MDQTIKLVHPEFRRENLGKANSTLDKNRFSSEFYAESIKKINSN